MSEATLLKVQNDVRKLLIPKVNSNTRVRCVSALNSRLKFRCTKTLSQWQLLARREYYIITSLLRS